MTRNNALISHFRKTGLELFRLIPTLTKWRNFDLNNIFNKHYKSLLRSLHRHWNGMLQRYICDVFTSNETCPLSMTMTETYHLNATEKNARMTHTSNSGNTRSALPPRRTIDYVTMHLKPTTELGRDRNPQRMERRNARIAINEHMPCFHVALLDFVAEPPDLPHTQVNCRTSTEPLRFTLRILRLLQVLHLRQQKTVDFWLPRYRSIIDFQRTRPLCFHYLLRFFHSFFPQGHDIPSVVFTQQAKWKTRNHARIIQLRSFWSKRVVRSVAPHACRSPMTITLTNSSLHTLACTH